MVYLIYKKANNIGYKTAQRRFAMEVRDLTIALIVVHCRGDPGLFLKDKKWPEFLPTMTALKPLFYGYLYILIRTTCS